MHLTPKPSASSRSLTILNASDVDTILSHLDLETALSSQAAIFKAFSSHSNNDIQIPHRLSIHSDSHTTLFMPSRAAPRMGCKVVSVPKGAGNGLPATTMVVDEETGVVKGIVNARKLTAMRNALGKSTSSLRPKSSTEEIGSALFARSCPERRALRNLVIFGTGAQAHSHATIFLRLFPYTSLILIARTLTSRAQTLLADLQAAFPNVSIHLAAGSESNLQQTVHNADTIITATNSSVPLFNSVDVCSGTIVVLIGSYKKTMREVDPELMRRAGVVVVDSKEACVKEAGEVDEGMGLAELGEVLDEKEAVGAEGDVMVFKSVSSISLTVFGTFW